jgi:hypothetical protein
VFKINCRIVDDFDALKSMEIALFDNEYNHISGFFEFCFGKQKEGCYYHENPLREGERGVELLDYWLNCLLDVINHFSMGATYVAFKELETSNRWLEFKKVGSTVIVNAATEVSKTNNELFITNTYGGFNYVEPCNFHVGIYKFKEEVLSAVNCFFNQVQKLNPNLLKTKMSLELLNKL